MVVVTRTDLAQGTPADVIDEQVVPTVQPPRAIQTVEGAPDDPRCVLFDYLACVGRPAAHVYYKN